MSIYRGRYYSATGCDGGPRPGTTAVMSYYLGAYADRGAANLGTYACKRLGSGWSIHAERRAGDAGTSPYGGVDSTWGWQLANAMRLNSHELGIQCLILGRRIWSCTQPDAGWRTYNGEYHGHLHFELTPDASRTLTAARIQALIGSGKPAPATAVPSGTPVLRRGTTGARVGQLQEALNLTGAGLRVDNDFGPATQAALKAYQRAAGLKDDGIYGPATEAALRKELEMSAEVVWNTDNVVEAPNGSSTKKTNTHWRAGYMLTRIADNTLYRIPKELDKVAHQQEAILAAVSGKSADQILARIEENHSEQLARIGALQDLLDEAHEQISAVADLIQRRDSGELTAEQVVDELGRRIHRPSLGSD